MATYSLSGTGTQTLTAGTGALYVTITTLPSGSGNGGANPADYYGIGLIRPGNATAFWEPFPVIGGPQWMPVPAGTTRIGYALFDGAEISVAEVSGSSPLAFPLASLPDVALASVADAQVLTYQASTSKWINATPTGGGGGSGSLTTLSTNLTSDLSCPNSTWTNVLSLSLAAGTWMVWAALHAWVISAATVGVRVWNGTTVYGSAEVTQNTDWRISPHITTEPIVLSSTTTITMQANPSSTVTAKANLYFFSTVPKATYMRALKVA